MEKTYQKVMNYAYQKYLEELKTAETSGKTDTEGFVAQ
jgi:hypothetical protein